MTMRKMLAASTAALLCAAGLTACGGADSGGTEQDGDVTMTFWHNASTGAGKTFWDDTVAAFEAANPGVTIEVDAPHGALVLDAPGYYRVDVGPQRTAFTLRRGRATLALADGAPIELSEILVG